MTLTLIIQTLTTSPGNIRSSQHMIYNKYSIPCYAARDIEQYEEIFGKYEMTYWKRIDHYSKLHSPHIRTGEHYENEMKEVMKIRPTPVNQNKNKKKKKNDK